MSKVKSLGSLRILSLAVPPQSQVTQTVKHWGKISYLVTFLKAETMDVMKKEPCHNLKVQGGKEEGTELWPGREVNT